MAQETRPVLTEYLARHYVSLKHRLTRLLGSSDLAGDALQDTWLRLQSRPEEDEVQSPVGYVLRVAVNIAVDIRRRQARTLSWDEVQEVQSLVDPAPGPARTAEARSEMALLLERVGRMPARRQDIFLLVHWEGLSHKEAADRLGVSQRTVAYELKRAHEAVDAVMNPDKK
ncbi:RNA polymerase sigma factor [Variovorax sp.]|jgi:RNA polymerase sigma factor (sigma-70 family)|uniref:RNA polymerase sigma factor n=1 Tax=Variovorax sp. TaxID=1871043 RepID=UPI001209C8B5|nr:sigma-70 family RNA polymerase sigma factor [Variovorax sp.]KAF1073151.1 MAG: putative RNA polymerase sigma factor FecI [Variovorax sp.]TAJ63080.1 MAG: sigma-70 family RNA polymerase sigma factor [Variovorax sp.]